MEFKLYHPRKNLGCLGVRIGQLYFDFHRTWSGRIQLYVSYPPKRIKGWIIPPLYKLRWKKMR